MKIMKKENSVGKEKWTDPWFLHLNLEAKVLWCYMLETCDCAGIFTFSEKLASLQVARVITEDVFLASFSDKLLKICNGAGKYLIRDFVHAKCKIKYNPKNGTHREIATKLHEAGLSDSDILLVFAGKLNSDPAPSSLPSTLLGIPDEALKSENTSRAPRPRNLPMDALVEVFGIEERAIGANEGKAIREIRRMCIGDSDEEIARQIRVRYSTYKTMHPLWDLTINSLVKHWGTLTLKNAGVRFNP